MSKEELNDLSVKLQIQEEIFGTELFEKIEGLDDIVKAINAVPHQHTIKKSETQPKIEKLTPEKKSIPEPPKTVLHEPAVTKFAAVDSTQFNKITSLKEFNELICECQKCPLGKTRNKFVFGSGNHYAKVMVVGEGPGADEDASGLPFVGRAGELLTKMMAAIGFNREEIFIANVVKCRPPGNRTPSDSEITECLPYLLKQIQLIKPVMILCAGTTAIQALMGRKGSLGSFRSQFYSLEDALVLATYHPAALIRNPEWKKPAWEDLKKFRAKYNELTGEFFEIKG